MLTPSEWIEKALDRYNEKVSGPGEYEDRSRLVLTSLLEVLEDDEGEPEQAPNDEWGELLSSIETPNG